MAELTIHKHDGTTDSTGASAIIRDACSIHIKDAKKIVQHCINGGRSSIQVPFAIKEEIAKKLQSKGFITS